MTHRKQFSIILLLFLLPFALLQAQKPKQNQKKRDEPREIKVPDGLTYDVLQYREGEHPRAGQLAISYKPDGVKKKPVVVFIHGGGWAKGDKDAVTYQVFNVAKSGYVGVTISYRLISEAGFPACIEDVKQAIRYVKSLEGKYPIDVNRIGIWGYSAGAHLALMIGLSPDKTFKTETLSGYDAKVKSIMAVSAPTDFVTRKQLRGSLNFVSESQNNDENFLHSVSPITYVHKKQLPVFMLHGTADPIVKPFHYQKFAKKCEEKGVKNFKLFEFKDAKHMFYFKQQKEVKPVFQSFLKSI